MIIKKSQEKNLITIEKGEPVTSSIVVAETFNKHHKTVIRKIDDLTRQIEIGTKLCQSNFFEKSEYLDDRNRPQPMYYINRDGFALLVMGFTGQEALEWKLKYINAFNAMEEKLRSSNYTPDNRSEVAKLILKASKIQISAIKELYPEYFPSIAQTSYLETISDVNTSYVKWIEDHGITREWIGEFPTTDIYHNYVRYCTENRLLTMGKKTFYKMLESDFDVIKRQRHNGRRYFMDMMI